MPPRQSTGLPPNPRLWPTERHAIALRQSLALADDAPLSCRVAFGRLPGVTVVPMSRVPCTAVHAAVLLRPDGGVSACTVPLGPTESFVLYNDEHQQTRTRVSLMEEYFHIVLGHPPTKIRLSGDTGLLARTFNSQVEEEAYQCAAASLLPYRGLRELSRSGATTSVIASHYRVSEPLVTFRLRITRLTRRRVRS